LYEKISLQGRCFTRKQVGKMIKKELLEELFLKHDNFGTGSKIL